MPMNRRDVLRTGFAALAGVGLPSRAIALRSSSLSD